MLERVGNWIPLLPLLLLEAPHLSHKVVPIAVDEITAPKNKRGELLNLSSAEWSLVKEVKPPTVLAHLAHPFELKKKKKKKTRQLSD